MEETRWGKKFRALTFALIFSGALNIALLGTWIFSSIEEKQPLPSPREVAQKQEVGNLEYLSAMSRLSFRELVSFLTNYDPVEEGYLKRDLALAALVAFCDFNVEKALCGSLPQRRLITLPSGQKVEIFPGLTDEQFQAIIKFSYEEKWPLTSKGLLRVLKKWPKPRDESLQQAFLITDEFHALQTLFQKSGSIQPASVLVDLVCEGDWDLLERFYKEQQEKIDFSEERRQLLLSSYLALKSKTAAHLLLAIDFSFALKKLSDMAVLDLLSLLDPQLPETGRYCTELLRSPRSDAVLELAKKKSEGKKEKTTEHTEKRVEPQRHGEKVRTQNAERRSEEKNETTGPTSITEKKGKFHEVKEGETLWKIARQYRLSVDELVRLNELQKDQIFPGMVLRVVQGTESDPPR